MKNKKSIFSTLTVGSLLLFSAFNANANIYINEPIVKSYFGQPLVVEIPVQADAADWDSLWGTVELTNGLMMETTWKKPFSPGTLGSIEIRTSRSIFEPVIDLKIRVESMKNQAVMYYPILVDKFGVADTIPPVNSSVTVDNVKLTNDAMKLSTSLNNKESKNIIPPKTIDIKTPSYDQVTSDYKNITVKAGDTLYKLAKRYKSSNISTYDAVNLIYKQNKNVIGKNINIIKVGMVLNLPF